MLLGSVPVARAQPSPAPEIELARQEDASAQRTARLLALQLAELDARIALQRERLEAAESLARVEQLSAELSELDDERRTLRGRLALVLTGVEFSVLDPSETEISWEEEAEELLAPLLQEVRQATSKPRRIEALRRRIFTLEERIPAIRQALDELAPEGEGALDPAVAQQIERVRTEWQERLHTLEEQRQVARAELARLTVDQVGLMDSSRRLAGLFFRSRGRNLLHAMLAFLAVFAGVRLAYRGVGRLFATPEQGPRRPDAMLLRLLDLAVYVVATVGAVLAALAVLYASGDWTLLILASAVLLGLAWSAREGIPRAWDEIRLLLNIGSVRQGERVVWQGVPFLVESLRLVSYLRNPAFGDLRVRLPLSQLRALQSRPLVAGEPWFPTRVGDWLERPDKMRVQVESQGPDFVRLRGDPGEFVYRTADFMGLGWRNLSRGFGIWFRVPIHRRHAAEVEQRIPATLKAAILQRLEAHPQGQAFTWTSIRFREIRLDSFHISVKVGFDGAVAEYFGRVRDLVVGTVLATLQQHGWALAQPDLQLAPVSWVADGGADRASEDPA